MHHLSDQQAAQLSGGRLYSCWGGSRGYNPRRGLGFFLWNSRRMLQGIFNNVSQVNVAVNLAIFGGTVINNQANLLAVNNTL